VGANWAIDEAQKWSGSGFSTIYDKSGDILAQAKQIIGDQIIYADLPYEPPVASACAENQSTLKSEKSASEKSTQ